MNGWKISTVLMLAGICVAAGSYLAFPNQFKWVCDCPLVENESIEMYNRGYVQGINDMVIEAYKNGIVKIPFNETHYVALKPWEE